MNVRIEVVSTAITTIEGVAKSSGKPFKMHKQECYLHNGHHYPDRFEITLQEAGELGVVAYQPGFYTLAPGSITVNREYGNLEINRYEMQLVRVPDEAPAKPVAAKAGG
ncbi:single-stranded DNA-binding protein [Stenotrophomonas sp. 278]|uniref:single-stranded DNA-binding protein n=1 Tax=Stenotrophomonas sp. 278 TaxID=2479851 RepID=UPI000F66921A|nr:single-stranded DNA-binding protein [Stenotrophomonas sp. 278]RRU12119.1 helix-destabilizing protein [Stenotrophomonas sp. 278]